MNQTTNYTEKFFKEQTEGSLSSAREIVPLIVNLVHPKSVVDIGCGLGAFLSVFKECGVDEILGIDGDYVAKEMLLIPQSDFQAMDVSKPFKLNRTFDLALSLEVAEHIPPDDAVTFIESLTQLAPVILFSAAIPFQGGTDHVNEQWPDYWANLFLQKNYVLLDCLRSQIWENKNVAFWYSQNTFIYVEKNLLEKNSNLSNEYKKTCFSGMSLVHPRQHELMNQKIHAASDLRWASLKDVLTAMPTILKSAFVWEIGKIKKALKQ